MEVLYKRWSLTYHYDAELKMIRGQASASVNRHKHETFQIEVPVDSLHEAYSKSKLNTLEHLFKQKVDKRIAE